MDLTSLTPEQLRTLKTQLDDLTDASGRSPFRPRQLSNLNLQPTATDPRPLFVWSAESPRNVDVSAQHEYPKLMWHRETGAEITVRSSADERQMSDLYQTEYPAAVVVDPMQDLKDQLDGLSESERALILSEQKKDRMASLQARLAALPEATLEALLSGAEVVPVKRGPGRPKKAVA